MKSQYPRPQQHYEASVIAGNPGRPGRANTKTNFRQKQQPGRGQISFHTMSNMCTDPFFVFHTHPTVVGKVIKIKSNQIKSNRIKSNQTSNILVCCLPLATRKHVNITLFIRIWRAEHAQCVDIYAMSCQRLQLFVESMYGLEGDRSSRRHSL